MTEDQFEALRRGGVGEEGGGVIHHSLQIIRRLHIIRLTAKLRNQIRKFPLPLPMVVSGWYKALNGQMSVMWAGTAFRDAYPEIFRYTYHP